MSALVNCTYIKSFGAKKTIFLYSLSQSVEKLASRNVTSKGALI